MASSGGVFHHRQKTCYGLYIPNGTILGLSAEDMALINYVWHVKEALKERDDFQTCSRLMRMTLLLAWVTVDCQLPNKQRI